jgi:nicotinate-nucleotide pyrophosphorylase (carboxylating)
VRLALEEDQASADITTIATVVSNKRARGSIVARARGVVAGVPLAVAAFRLLDPRVTVRVDLADGAAVRDNSVILYLSGHARSLLSAERVALNYMQRLSGIATLTSRFVAAVSGTGVRIMDTRKTTPGWRALEKYAVRVGGGFNHRMSLADMILIKDNHLIAADGNVARAIERARRMADPGIRVEVECDNVDQVRAAVDAGAEMVLLDNMAPQSLAASVKVARGKAVVEASGGVTLENVRAVAETGVNCISVGSLTHSAAALDIALDLDPS